MYMLSELFLLWLIVDIGKAALATVLSVKVGGHENTSATVLIGTLTAQTCDLAILINLQTSYSLHLVQVKLLAHRLQVSTQNI